MKYLYATVLTISTLLLLACAGLQEQQCPPGTQNLPDCPPTNAIDDESINKLYASRTWLPPSKQTIDPIKMGKDAKIPINQVRSKVIGPTFDDALKSLTAKIWLIENAQHTVDVMYYIFKRDLVGYSMLGALCNAVQRGVDVRIMVDSLGSLHVSHDELRALETCANEAGFIKNTKGQITTRKARVQVMIFNAISKFNFNRRSHDKLLVIDGHFPDKAAVMTGGRNISLDYYGIKEDGSKDPTAFRDLEILLRANKTNNSEAKTIGSVSEFYYTLLYLHKGNKRLTPMEDDDYEDFDHYKILYQDERKKSQQSLAFLKSLPEIQKRMQDMPRYMSEGFRNAEVRLAHQLSNLTATKVTTKALENIEGNPNSIMYLINKISEKRLMEGVTSGTLRMVSPYLFTYTYKDEDGKVVFDEAQEILKKLRDNPGLRLEVVTNSVMTGDNSFTQAMIDIDMIPRFLLTPELQEVWKSDTEEAESNPNIVESEEWKKLINHPQIFIYQMGKLDSILLGKGTTYYGKLHAKFIIGDKVGFIGTSNFDYRSNLYNNEMGFFYRSPELRQDLIKIFELLKSNSYRWGTPEWLQMRKELMAADTEKSGPARKQRNIYQGIKAFGLQYLM
jgi:phosphatidylserine/phosphatidylglycerophosphate/cardiolipin synthase-like enzyme